MEQSAASTAFATLGHPGRLAVFRLLMRFAPRGARPTEIAAALDLRPNTLSHYLSDLAAAGLIRATRTGRSLLYAVDLDRTESLIGYLALDVGRGRPDLLAPLCPAAIAHDPPLRVLFLCSANSARSLIAEALLRDLGGPQVAAASAGTTPGPAPHPLALDVLRRHGHATAALQSKTVAQAAPPGAPPFDVILTVCDMAAAQDCAPWPGQPVTAHWGLPDPVRATGTDADRAQAFARTYADLRRRIAAFTALPLSSLNRLSLQSRVDAIGADMPAPA